jgi:phosphohistidine phosphatase SixA
MQIYLLRHGIAEDAKPGHPDSERPLTDEGRDKLRRVLKPRAPPTSIPA